MTQSFPALFGIVTLCFLERGYSFLPCERNFGPIIRILRKVDKVYTLEQYLEMKLTPSINWLTKKSLVSRVGGNKYELGRNIFKRDLQGQEDSFKSVKYRTICFLQSYPGKIVMRQFIDRLVFQTFTLRCSWIPNSENLSLWKSMESNWGHNSL